MIKKERKSKPWRRMRNMVGKKRGRSVLSVKVPTVDEEGNNTTQEYVTQQDIFDAAKPVLTDCFSGAFSSAKYRS